MENPLVSCLMVTGGEERAWWAERAYQAFVEQQDYDNRELLVVNESKGTPWEFRVTSEEQAAKDGVRVREIMLPHASCSVGEMRNISKTEADGAWLCQWDDDDWSSPIRVASQMKHRKEGCCQTLYAQVRYCMNTGTAYAYTNPGTGIAGTLLHPRTDFLYPAQQVHEDSMFLLAGWENRITVLDNYVCPHLYIRFCHGDNLSGRKRVMRKYAEEKWKGRWVDLPEQWGWMPRKAAAYLKGVLTQRYGVKIPYTPWIDVLLRRREEHMTDDDTIRGLRAD
jgi:hypothetical protein